MDPITESTVSRIKTTISISEHESGQVKDLFFDLVYHPVVKGLILSGASRSGVASLLGRRKRDILEVAATPFTALSGRALPGLDRVAAFREFWDQSGGPRMDADQALIDCIIYDGLEWPDDRPIVRRSRYSVDDEWILGAVVRAAAPSDDPESARKLVDAEQAADLLGCSPAAIAQARAAHASWTVPLADLDRLAEMVDPTDSDKLFVVNVARALLLRRYSDTIPAAIMHKRAPRGGGHDPLGRRPEEVAEAIATAQQTTAQWERSLAASGGRILLRDVNDLLAWGEEMFPAPPAL